MSIEAADQRDVASRQLGAELLRRLAQHVEDGTDPPADMVGQVLALPVLAARVADALNTVIARRTSSSQTSRTGIVASQMATPGLPDRGTVARGGRPSKTHRNLWVTALYMAAQQAGLPRSEVGRAGLDIAELFGISLSRVRAIAGRRDLQAIVRAAFDAPLVQHEIALMMGRLAVRDGIKPSGRSR